MSQNLSYPFVLVLFACVSLSACTDKSKPSKPLELPPAQKALMQAKQSYDAAQKAEAALDFEKAKTHYEAAHKALDIKQSTKAQATITSTSANQPWGATAIKTQHLPRVEQKLQMSRDTLGWVKAEIESQSNGNAKSYKDLVWSLISSKDLPTAKAHLKQYEGQLSALDRDELQSRIKSHEDMSKLLNAEKSVAKMTAQLNTNQTVLSKHTFGFAKLLQTQSIDKVLAYISGVKNTTYQKALYGQTFRTIKNTPQLKSREDKQRLLFNYLQALPRLETDFQQTSKAYRLFKAYRAFGSNSEHELAVAINKKCDDSPLSIEMLKAKYFAVGSMDGEKHKETRQKHVLLLGEQLLKLHQQKKAIDEKLLRSIYIRVATYPNETTLAMMNKLEAIAPASLKGFIARQKVIAHIKLKKPYDFQSLTTLKFAHLDSAKDNKLGDITADLKALKNILTVSINLHKHKQLKPIKPLTRAVEQSLKKHQRVAKTFKDDPKFKTIIAKHNETLANLHALQDNHSKVIAYIKPVIEYQRSKKKPSFPSLSSVDKINWKKVRAKQAKQLDNLLLQLIAFDRYNYRFNMMFKQWAGHKLATKDFKTIKTLLDQQPKAGKKFETLDSLARTYTELPKEAQSSEMTTYFFELLSTFKSDSILMPQTHHMVGMCQKLNCQDRLFAVLLAKDMKPFSHQIMLSSWAIYKQSKAVDAYIAKLPNESERIALQVESLGWRIKYGDALWKDIQGDIEQLHKKSLNIKNKSNIINEIIELHTYHDRCHELFDFISSRQLTEAVYARAATSCTRRQNNVAHDYPEYTAKLIMASPADQRISLLFRWISTRGVIATPALQAVLKPYAAKRIGL